MTTRTETRRTVHRASLALCLLLCRADLLVAQADSARALLRVRVMHDSAHVTGAVVRAGTVAALTNDTGIATLSLARGRYALTVARIGFRAETLSVVARAGLDTGITVNLEPLAAEMERVTVGATRTDRRIEDVPLRVEVLSRDEVEEKMLMTPGDISMLLNETGGLRVQSTSPSLGGASIRMQGLQGRYTLLLADGLPLYGGQTGSFGLLQIPPMDLGQVEVIKGVASALYGASALGGVVNLISRRPPEEGERELLVNQTSRSGTDVVGWSASRLDEHWGYTLLASGHGQARRDVDDDGWTDLPGYSRGVVRPRLFWTGADGRNALVTAGATVEERRGGTVGGRVAPDGLPYAEALGTRRFDGGAIANVPWGASILSVRGSASVQAHDHQFGATRERDRHETYFAEAAWRATRGVQSGVLGLAMERESYVGTDVNRFDYGFTTPAVFAQYDVEPSARVALSASARVDAHSEYGTVFNPRVSMLLRGPATWTARASVGTGAFAPTPFTSETEVTGLAPLRSLANLRVERARSASLDIGGITGPLEMNATLFASRITGALETRAVAGMPTSVELVSALEPTVTSGADGLLRIHTGVISTTASYAYTRSTIVHAGSRTREIAPLTPTHTAGVVSMWEEEGRGRAGIEIYYTGTQRLEENPYRSTSPAYVLFGAMGEHRVGSARVFVNIENLGNVRLTNWQRLVLPARGPGGRWTTDAWAPLDGRTVNAGMRFNLGGSGE